MLTREERQKLMDENPPEVGSIFHADAYFDWGWQGCGFGQFSFGYDRETKTWHCDNEMMSPERVRTLLHAFADHVADKLKPVIEKEEAEWQAKRNSQIE